MCIAPTCPNPASTGPLNDVRIIPPGLITDRRDEHDLWRDVNHPLCSETWHAGPAAAADLGLADPHNAPCPYQDPGPPGQPEGQNSALPRCLARRARQDTSGVRHQTHASPLPRQSCPASEPLRIRFSSPRAAQGSAREAPPGTRPSRVQPSSSSTVHVVTTRSAGTSHSSARAQP